jgi:hypothetical protein
MDHSPHGFSQNALFLLCFPKDYSLENLLEYASVILNVPHDHRPLQQKKPLLWLHGTSNNKHVLMQDGTAASAQQPTLRLQVFVELTAIDPCYI